MKRRSALANVIAILWATLQVLSPGVSAIADGMIARENAAGPRSHVEAPGSSTCPVAHSPDCGMCRYLSTGSVAPALPGLPPEIDTAACPIGAPAGTRSSGNAFLPHGRAPPAV